MSNNKKRANGETLKEFEYRLKQEAKKLADENKGKKADKYLLK
jgi:hypothetical protein